jgi:hypothetical protein
MMKDTFGFRYSALSGLEDFSFTFHTGLHPVLTDYALAGLCEISAFKNQHFSSCPR